MRVRFFASMALGKLGRADGFAPIVQMLRENGDDDPYLRHAGVMGLLGCQQGDALDNAAKDTSSAVRMAALLAFRRLGDARVAGFLKDPTPNVVVEAARAVNDASIYAALPQLASLITEPGTSTPLSRRVVNANFRLGAPSNAQALANYAADDQSLTGERVEALECLQMDPSQWSRPLDRSLAPLASRDASPGR